MQPYRVDVSISASGMHSKKTRLRVFMLDMSCVINSLLHALGVWADGVSVDRINTNYPELTSDKLSCSSSYTYVMRTTHLIIVIRVYSIV